MRAPFLLGPPRARAGHRFNARSGPAYASLGRGLWLAGVIACLWPTPLFAQSEEGIFVDVAQEVGFTHKQRARHYFTFNPTNPTATMAATGGAAVGDFFGNGLLDVFFTRHDNTDILYRNMGDGTFQDVTTEVFGPDPINAQTNGAMFADLNNDGALDLYVTSNGGNRHFLYMNDGRGKLTEQAMERGVADFISEDHVHAGASVTAGDYTGNGYLDLYVANWNDRVDGRGTSRLFRNLGNGYFEDVTDAAGINTAKNRRGFSGRFADMDRDGKVDLLTVNDFINSQYFRNNGDGTFTEVSGEYGTGTGYNEMGSTIADYNNDGYLDWFTTNIGDLGGNRLYRNEMGRNIDGVYFTDQTDNAGVRRGHWGWGGTFFDHNNNGYQDIVMVNGWNEIQTPMKFWRNDGPDSNFTFTLFADEMGLTDRGEGRGILVADFFNTGFQDILIINHGTHPVLYRNPGGTNSHLRIDTVGEVSNTMGIGAFITVTPDLDEDFSLFHEVHLGANYLAHNETTAHFGLGDLDGLIDYIHILWPSGIEQEFFDISPNQLLTVYELGGLAPQELVAAPEPSSFALLLLAGGVAMRRPKRRWHRPAA